MVLIQKFMIEHLSFYYRRGGGKTKELEKKSTSVSKQLILAA
jgi:hypothetical protein